MYTGKEGQYLAGILTYMTKKNKTKITKDDLLKMMKKVNREFALENPGPRGGFHKSKKDKKPSNTVRSWEDV